MCVCVCVCVCVMHTHTGSEAKQMAARHWANKGLSLRRTLWKITPSGADSRHASIPPTSTFFFKIKNLGTKIGADNRHASIPPF